MNNLGAGVGRLDGMVVFVQGGCTGDLIDARLIKVTKSYLVARIEAIIEPSPYRIESECPMSKRCGGCVYRNVTYAHELECKRRTVEAAMHKNHVDAKVFPPLFGEPDGYRNKAQYPVGRAKDGSTAIGFYAGKTHEIVDMTVGCRLQPTIFSDIVDFLRNKFNDIKLEPYDELSGKGIIRHIYLRRSGTSGKVMVCLVATRRFDEMFMISDEIMARFGEVSGVLLNLNPKNTNVVLGKEFILLRGEETLEDELCGRRFTISPASFWQVNRRMAEVLYRTAGELAAIKPGERVLDLFCGIGSVGQSICEPGTELSGVEIVPEAVENARKNALRNGFPSAEYFCLDADDPNAVEREIIRLAERLDVIILDPPRGGCSKELLEILSKHTRARIVYISCGPEALARDLALMQSFGYAVGELRTVDLFPRTGHIETVCLLSRGDIGSK